MYLSVEEEAEEQLKAYEDIAFVDSVQGVRSVSLTQGLRWWANLSRDNLKRFPDLRVVAMSVCAIMAGSGNLENSFSSAADVFTRRRSSLDDVNGEMLTVLNHAFRNGWTPVPDEIHILDERQAAEAIPPRLRDPRLLALWKDLDYQGIGDPNGFEDLAAMTHWTSVAEMAINPADDGMDDAFVAEMLDLAADQPGDEQLLQAPLDPGLLHQPDDPQQPDHGGEQLQQPGMGFGALLAAVNMQQH